MMQEDILDEIEKCFSELNSHYSSESENSMSSRFEDNGYMEILSGYIRNNEEIKKIFHLQFFC